MIAQYIELPKPKSGARGLGIAESPSKLTLHKRKYDMSLGLGFLFLVFGLLLWPPCRRYGWAPTSSTASLKNHEKINSWVSFSFLYGYGAFSNNKTITY